MMPALLVALALAAAPQPSERWLQCAGEDAVAAIESCSAIIRGGGERGTLAIAYFNRGLAYHRRSQFERANVIAGASFEAAAEQALKDYGEAIRLRPDYAEAYSNRGIVYYDKGQFDRAIQDYDQAIRLNPELPEAYNNRSLAWYKKGQYGLATRDFDHTIKLNKNYGNAMINRAVGPSEAPVRAIRR